MNRYSQQKEHLILTGAGGVEVFSSLDETLRRLESLNLDGVGARLLPERAEPLPFDLMPYSFDEGYYFCTRCGRLDKFEDENCSNCRLSSNDREFVVRNIYLLDKYREHKDCENNN